MRDTGRDWERDRTDWDNMGRRREVGKEAFAPQWGYGNRSMGPLPANATLIFEVESMDNVGRQGRWRPAIGPAYRRFRSQPSIENPPPPWADRNRNTKQ